MNTSLLKAIDLLNIFSTNEPRLSLAEISRRLNIPKSTSHRILSTLLSRGFIEKVGDDDYSLGTAIIALTQPVRVNVEIRDRAATIARALAEKCNESVYVAIHEHDCVLYIYAIETSQRLAARTAIGDRAPLYCTGVGKVTVAFLQSEVAAALVEHMTFEPSTPNTITSRDVFLEEIADIRQRGYALDRQEHELGTYCIAAPFFGDRGNVLGAISTSGRDPHIVDGRQAELSAWVMEAANQISGRLGYVATSPGAAPPGLFAAALSV